MDELLKALDLKIVSFLLLFDCFDSIESISNKSRSILLDRSQSNDMFFKKLDFDDKNGEEEFISFILLKELFDDLIRLLFVLAFTDCKSLRSN